MNIIFYILLTCSGLQHLEKRCFLRPMCCGESSSQWAWQLFQAKPDELKILIILCIHLHEYTMVEISHYILYINASKIDRLILKILLYFKTFYRCPAFIILIFKKIYYKLYKNILKSLTKLIKREIYIYIYNMCR